MSELEISGLRVDNWNVVIEPDGCLIFSHEDSLIFDLEDSQQPELHNLAALIAAVAKLQDQQ